MAFIKVIIIRVQLLLIFLLLFTEPSGGYAIDHPSHWSTRPIEKRKEVTNRNDVRASIASGGWVIVWGDLINEADIVSLIVSVPTGTVGVWVQQQVQAQLQKFQQSLDTVSDDVIAQAIDFLTQLLENQQSGEQDINGIGIKAGIATYTRKEKNALLSISLPNNHQPYFGLRVVKPLPLKGT
jgi:hypothetical protein